LNCFTPVAWAVVTRLNGGNRLVSTYGANAAAPADEAAADELGAAETLGAGVVDFVADGAGEAVAEPLGERETERLGVGVGAADGAALGAVLTAWHAIPLIMQSLGWPAVAEEAASKPTVVVPPAPMVASQLAFFTVTWLPLLL
jgi:hypothetical protein